MHPILSEMIDLLTENGISQETAIPIVNQILELIQNSTLNLSERIPNHLKIGRYSSAWDDGSSFTSNCIVNMKTRCIESITTAGIPNDNATCICQSIHIDDETYEVFDPDEQDNFDPTRQIRLY